LVIAVFAAMAAWTWLGWNDPIVDFGRELYVPWRITEGQVLYRDIAHFNGPLSAYFNAIVFKVLGVSLRSIIIANLILLAGLTAMVWRLFARIADQFTATAVCVALLTVFSFIQLVPIGNYNFVTPYSHELTHGIFLSFAAMICLARDLRSARSIWLIVAGLSLGLVFLTKAEVFLAAGLAVPIGVIIGSRGRVVRVLGFFSGAAVLPPLLAFCLLSLAMPASDAFRGTLGSWVHVFDARISGMKFYTDMLGTSDLPASLLGLMLTCLLYLLVLMPALIAATLAKRKSAAWVAFASSILAVSLLYWLVDPQWWQTAFRGLPVVLTFHVVLLAIRWWPRRRDVDHRQIMQLVVSIFALLLLAKMGLNVWFLQYGFALAMPAMLVCAAILLCWVPREIERYKGNGALVRAAMTPMLVLVIVVHLRPFSMLFSSKPRSVASGSDQFHWFDPRVPPLFEIRGEAVSRILSDLSELPPDASLAVVPEGVMINYLSRRANPTPYINLMPPELLMFGQENILHSFQEHAPDYVVIVQSSEPASYGFDSPAADYRARILPWIVANYTAIPSSTTPQYPLLTMKRK
jgi:hypothetical protein